MNIYYQKFCLTYKMAVVEEESFRTFSTESVQTKSHA